jgi:hypothetical protein
MLHGEIKVNGHEIGRWSARRLVHPPSPGANEYEIEVTYVDPEGREWGYRDTLWHNFGDGAITLAAEVLALVAPKLPPRGGS